MKKKIWIPALAITLLAMGYVAHAWGRLDTCPGKVWLHRCNSVEKLEEMSGRYPNVEVDICLRDGGVPDVTHDIDTTFHLSLTPYMDYLAHDPTRHMWLDVKNLDEDNQAAFIHVLDSMIGVHGVNKNQLVIESPEWQLLFPLTRAHYYTSCYVTAPRPSSLSQEQKDSVRCDSTRWPGADACVRSRFPPIGTTRSGDSSPTPTSTTSPGCTTTPRWACGWTPWAKPSCTTAA